MPLFRDSLLAFFTALGVVLGASILGSLAAVITNGSPMAEMNRLSSTIRLWAIVAAMGGTFPTIRAFETGLLGGEVFVLFRQVTIMFCGFVGAGCGRWIITSLLGGR